MPINDNIPKELRQAFAIPFRKDTKDHIQINYSIPAEVVGEIAFYAKTHKIPQPLVLTILLEKIIDDYNRYSVNLIIKRGLQKYIEKYSKSNQTKDNDD